MAVSTTTPIGIQADNRPTDYEYALISQNVYGSGETKPEEGAYFYTGEQKTKWIILNSKDISSCGYFGATYICHESQQIVVAHRGTNSFIDWIENVRGVLLNQNSPQKAQAMLLVDEAISWVQSQNKKYHLSFTGHSLGAFLAEISVYYAQRNCDFLHINAVTFESPGSKNSIQAMEVNNPDQNFDLKTVDIVSYVCYPNIINALNKHVGTVYSINVDLGTFGMWPGLHLFKCHSMQGIVSWFKKKCINTDSSCKRLYMADWPVTISQKNIFFKYAEFDNGQYTLKPEFWRGPSMKIEFKEAEDIERIKKNYKKKADIRQNGRFEVYNSLSSYNAMPLHHFCPGMQNFLRNFYERRGKLLESNKNHQNHIQELLVRRWKSMKLPENIIEKLKQMIIQRNGIGIEEIQIETANIADFRRDFSNWLEMSSKREDELVPGHLREFDVITTHEEYTNSTELQ